MLKNILLIVILLQLTRQVKLPGNEKLVTYVDRLSSYWGGPSVADALGVPHYSIDTKYNVIILAFVLEYGAADAADIFIRPLSYMEKNNNPFGNTTEAIQKNWTELYHQAGKKVLVSAYGSTLFPTSQGYNAAQSCTKMALYAKENNFDGIDIDYEDNDAMRRGDGVQWLIDCTRAIRVILPSPQYILTHAPQAPYFVGTKVYPNGAYLDVHKEVGHMIDWYNVQFYNQGDTNYDSYELLFIDAKYGEWNGTSVKQIMDLGIPKEKIVVGKPAQPHDAMNSGYVTASDLHDWALKASQEIGWQTGMMTWQYSSDKNGDFVNTYMNGK